MNALSTENETKAVENKQALPVACVVPRVNIVEDKEAYRLEAEMPGVNKEGLEVVLDGNELTIIGRRVPSHNGPSYLYRESRTSDYRRVFEVESTIDAAKIVARMEQGVMTLVLPKSEQAKPRRVPIME